jgi:hypothetical protein
MRTQSGIVLVLPARADRSARPSRLVPQPADRAGQVVYLPRPRRDDADRWPAPVRRVLGITGGWLQAVREQSSHSEHPGQSADRVAVRTVHAARRDARIAARPADREVVPAASRPGHQPGTRKLVLLSQEI